MNYKPLGQRVLVKPLEVEEKTSGGIFLPDSAIDRDKALQQDAVIVAMGELAFKHELGGKLIEYPDKPKVGDVVRIVKYVGDAFVDDDHYRLINDVDILAIKGANNG